MCRDGVYMRGFGDGNRMSLLGCWFVDCNVGCMELWVVELCAALDVADVESI